MQIITNSLIESFDPCKSGIDNFNKLYPNYNDTILNFLKLPNIPYADKIWLATRVVDVKILQHWSVGCAESVVENYNKRCPDDARTSDCIEITKKYLADEISIEDLSAAWSAARSAESAAWSAARSAESAAWAAARAAAESAEPAESAKSAAESAAWASRSAAESAADSAADSAAWTSRSAAWKEQEQINLNILIKLLEKN